MMAQYQEKNVINVINLVTLQQLTIKPELFLLYLLFIIPNIVTECIVWFASRQFLKKPQLEKAVVFLKNEEAKETIDWLHFLTKPEKNVQKNVARFG